MQNCYSEFVRGVNACIIYKSSLFKSLAHVLIGLCVVLEWSHVSSLYTLEIKPLYEVSLANTFSQKFIAAQFTIAKCWKQPKCPPVNEWIKQLWYIYTMEYYATRRKKELLPFATAWIDMESIVLSEVSQDMKDKYHMISPVSGPN